MDAVIKIGGSIAEIPDAFRALCLELSNIARKHQVVVIPGGGKFADIVRELDVKFGLPPLFSHRMAILSMDQFGLFLSQVIPNSCICDSFQEIEQVSESGKVALFLPSRLLFEEDPFKPSWDVTSDSISAYIAIKLQATKIILVTDVDGIFDKDPKQNSNSKLLSKVSAVELLGHGERSSVDRFLPTFLLENPLDCFVVNGLYPARISEILKGQKTTCTQIVKQK